MIFLSFAVAIVGGTIIGCFMPNIPTTTISSYIPFSWSALLSMCLNIITLLLIPPIILGFLIYYFIMKIDCFNKRQNILDFIMLLYVVGYIVYATYLDKIELLYTLF